MNLHSGEANLFNWFRRQRRPSGLVGVEIRTDGVALAKATLDGSRVDLFAFAECTAAKRLDTLRLLVEANGCEGAPCNLVLLPDQYSLIQVERPQVEDAELVEALRWRIKDMVDMAMDDAVMDVFDFPKDATRNRGPLVNVVVARKPVIREFVQLIEEVGLSLQSIDIAELAMRNLARIYEEEHKGVVTLIARRGGGVMTLTRDSTLYLSRRIDVDLRHLTDPDRGETIGQQLALEVQRSLDYYESQLGQAPANRLYVSAVEQSERLTQLLTDNLAIPVSPLPQILFLEDENLSTEQLPFCLLAAGGALREEAA